MLLTLRLFGIGRVMSLPRIRMHLEGVVARSVWTALAILFATRCTCDHSRPCISWARIGESYQVEIVQELGPDYFVQSPYPAGPVGTGAQKCGESFDLKVGDFFRMTAAARNDVEVSPQCVPCYNIRAEAMIDGVVFNEDMRSLGVGVPAFAWDGGVTFINGCKGHEYIGVMPVNWTYLERPHAFVATDYVVLREFSGALQTACMVPGGKLTEGNGVCWDAWAVRIRDANGKLISKDFGSVPSDAGSEEDGGS